MSIMDDLDKIAVEIKCKELKDIEKSLMDLNSSFSATQEFLKSKGKSHVKELTDSETIELTKHLQSMLNNLENKSNM